MSRRTAGVAGRWLESRRAWAPLAIGLAATAAIGAADLATGYVWALSAFYVIPIGFAAWAGGTFAGVSTAAAAGLAWWLVDRTNPVYVTVLELGWNVTARGAIFVVIAVLAARLRDALDRERALARTDPLTGALNRRTFVEALGREIGRAHRSHAPLTLAYLDLDRFKSVNDAFGHAAGDALLCGVVEAMRGHLRPYDAFARLGGDEFALLLPETDAAAGRAACERIADALGSVLRRRDLGVGASIGVVTFQPPPADAESALHAADGVMYGVKREAPGTLRCATVDGSIAVATAR